MTIPSRFAAAVPAAALLVAFVALAVLAAAAPTPAAADSTSVARALATADGYQAQRDFEGVITTCRAAVATDSMSYALWWRLARAYSDRGTRAQFDGDKDRAEISFEQAVKAGRRAVVLTSNEAEGHLELAVALGRLALFKGGKEKLRLSKEVKSEADRALALDPKLDRAEHVLGRWNRGIAELSFFEKAAANTILGGLPKGATMDAAVTHFEKAIALAPDYANHHLELGRTLLKIGLKAKAREQFEKALACPVGSPFDADYKAEAQQLMAKTK